MKDMILSTIWSVKHDLVLPGAYIEECAPWKLRTKADVLVQLFRKVQYELELLDLTLSEEALIINAYESIPEERRERLYELKCFAEKHKLCATASVDFYEPTPGWEELESLRWQLNEYLPCIVVFNRYEDEEDYVIIRSEDQLVDLVGYEPKTVYPLDGTEYVVDTRMVDDNCRSTKVIVTPVSELNIIS